MTHLPSRQQVKKEFINSICFVCLNICKGVITHEIYKRCKNPTNPHIQRNQIKLVHKMLIIKIKSKIMIDTGKKY